MPDFLIDYLIADRIGPALAFLAVAVVVAAVRHSERLRPERKQKP